MLRTNVSRLVTHKTPKLQEFRAGLDLLRQFDHAVLRVIHPKNSDIQTPFSFAKNTTYIVLQEQIRLYSLQRKQRKISRFQQQYSQRVHSYIVFSPTTLALGSLAIVKVSGDLLLWRFLGQIPSASKKVLWVLWGVPPTFSPTALALESSAILNGFFAANGFCLPKGSLECSPNNSLHLSQSLLQFFWQMVVASEKVQWRVPPTILTLSPNLLFESSLETVLYIYLPVFSWGQSCVNCSHVSPIQIQSEENNPSCHCCWGILWAYCDEIMLLKPFVRFNAPMPFKFAQIQSFNLQLFLRSALSAELVVHPTGPMPQRPFRQMIFAKDSCSNIILPNFWADAQCKI